MKMMLKIVIKHNKLVFSCVSTDDVMIVPKWLNILQGYSGYMVVRDTHDGVFIKLSNRTPIHNKIIDSFVKSRMYVYTKEEIVGVIMSREILKYAHSDLNNMVIKDINLVSKPKHLKNILDGIISDHFMYPETLSQLGLSKSNVSCLLRPLSNSIGDLPQPALQSENVVRAFKYPKPPREFVPSWESDDKFHYVLYVYLDPNTVDHRVELYKTTAPFLKLYIGTIAATTTLCELTDINHLANDFEKVSSQKLTEDLLGYVVDLLPSMTSEELSKIVRVCITSDFMASYKERYDFLNPNKKFYYAIDDAFINSKLTMDEVINNDLPRVSLTKISLENFDAKTTFIIKKLK